ncbi:MAG: Holliday junction resolvase RuvX [Planctomycetes bacterium]|nr:Holliday junction resolvase RuvX [Planctomycetota bacterium]
MSSPRPLRVLAVDWGLARTGLAATDWTGTIVVPLGRIDERDPKALCRKLRDLVAERQTQLIVLGMPLLVDGSAGERAQASEAFRQLLVAELGVPVVTVDESHSTDEAHERLKQGGMKAARRRELADSVAALVILERWRSLPWG